MRKIEDISSGGSRWQCAEHSPAEPLDLPADIGERSLQVLSNSSDDVARVSSTAGPLITTLRPTKLRRGEDALEICDGELAQFVNCEHGHRNPMEFPAVYNVRFVISPMRNFNEFALAGLIVHMDLGCFLLDLRCTARGSRAECTELY